MDSSASGEQSCRKRTRKALFDQRQVLDLLLEGDSDDEVCYESSGREYSGSKSSSNSSDDSDPESSSRPTALQTRPASKKPPSKKAKQTPQRQNISTLPRSKGKGKGMTSRSRSQAAERLHLDLDLNAQTDRHLLDAKNESVAVDGIDIEMIQTEWKEAGPDFSPQLHDFKGEGGIKFDDTNFTEPDYVAQFLNEEFGTLITNESNRKAEQFFRMHQNFSRRSIFPSWYDTNAEEMKKIHRIDPPARPSKETSLASELVERPTDLHTNLCCCPGPR
ncbi:hypothetical protein ElyMa_003329200 [Elysia marginata]|uniref:Uncharacterized protein n=1 Tax=Elysia marginata TaxID=1093978 RepID=A0AAV4JKI4_9GAST|nr:hypothetical protein ElyMa_003329200 [Elysia marginata]